ncbi:hypothetical protein NADFUDRAFT_45422 [Nadsonia fulvescens var. elongata DSM 6958]|uniref:Transcription initiation factor IIF subunit beta n=1 Tax=Nadsonia fulvescens var. elongata DSM 6958 TaxID=857566 RepID=A0A1E3PPV0_9ASCO|nr:hypothetical protein NADFUDRAFT_45422 [Nadsonia fulvescens var. elongata DSM 6958]
MSYNNVSVKAEPLSPGFEDDVSLSPASPRGIKREDHVKQEIYEDDEDDDHDNNGNNNGDDEDEDDDDEDDDEDDVEGEDDSRRTGEGYVDSLDLNTKDSQTKVWLVRLPKFLMEKWKNVDNISGQELGRVRISNERVVTSSSGDGSSSQGMAHKRKVKLVLNDTPETQDIPHEYDIDLVKEVVNNTFVFTEKNLPKYKRPVDTDNNSNNGNDNSSKGKPRYDKSRYKNQNNISNKNNEDSQTNSTDVNNNAPGGGGKQSVKTSRFNKERRFIPYTKIIPKKTAISGTVCHECVVMPSLHDENYNKVVSQRKVLLSSEPRPKVTFLNEIPGVTNGNAFNIRSPNTSQFLRAQKKNPKTTTEGKAIRMPRSELLDLLFKLFEEYDYWSLKGLRERTKQPESYLKEVLVSMAILNKRGPYALRYSLKPEYKQIKGIENSLSQYMERSGETILDDDDQNPDAFLQNYDSGNGGQGEEMEEDDEDIEMENVF